MAGIHFHPGNNSNAELQDNSQNLNLLEQEQREESIHACSCNSSSAYLSQVYRQGSYLSTKLTCPDCFVVQNSLAQKSQCVTKRHCLTFEPRSLLVPHKTWQKQFSPLFLYIHFPPCQLKYQWVSLNILNRLSKDERLVWFCSNVPICLPEMKTLSLKLLLEG